MRIGRNRRGPDPTGLTESGRRVVSGKKGLGKLALFGIGRTVVLSTTRAGSPDVLTISMDWNDLIGTESGDYKPDTTVEQADPAEHGTTVTVSNLNRTSDVSADDLAESLSRLFQYTDEDVSLVVVHRGGRSVPVTRELRMSSVDEEFRWNVTADLTEAKDLLDEVSASGVIIATEKPLRTHMRGVSVYAHGRLVHEAEFFGASDSSYAYAYLTGYVTIDRLDEIKPDVIATHRRAVNWEHSEAAPIRAGLRRMVEEIAQDRRRRRADKKKRQLEEETGVDAETWASTLLGPEQEPLRDLIGILESDETDMSDKDRGNAIRNLQEIAPPYADLVWRHLHPSIQRASERYFKSRDYYQALLEACKAYVADLRAAAQLPGEPEISLFGKALGTGDGSRLNFTHRFIDGTPSISNESARNLENGQRELAKAIWSAFRNPLSHEALETIRQLGVISPHDCLDAMSLMSHSAAALTRRSGHRKDGVTGPTYALSSYAVNSGAFDRDPPRYTTVAFAPALIVRRRERESFLQAIDTVAAPRRG